MLLIANLIQFREPPEEVYGSWRPQSVANGLEHKPLHASYVLFRVGVISDVGKVLHLREIDLFVFAGY